MGGIAEGREADVWRLRNSTWTSLLAPGPEARAEHEGVYVPGEGFLIFGGIVGQGMTLEERRKGSDTWIWDGVSWQRLSAG